MDPRHRDRVAFVRVCSGRFTKDMRFQQPGRKPLRASRAYRFFGRDRETINVAYAGRHHRPRQPGAFRDRRHAPYRRAAAISRSAAVSGRAFRPGPTEGRPLQTVRRWAEAARGRRADAGVLVAGRTPRADRRRRRRAAVRRDRQPAAQRVRRRGAVEPAPTAVARWVGDPSPGPPSLGGGAPSPSIGRTGASSCSDPSGRCITSSATSDVELLAESPVCQFFLFRLSRPSSRWGPWA